MEKWNFTVELLSTFSSKNFILNKYGWYTSKTSVLFFSEWTLHLVRHSTSINYRLTLTEAVFFSVAAWVTAMMCDIEEQGCGKMELDV